MTEAVLRGVRPALTAGAIARAANAYVLAVIGGVLGTLLLGVSGGVLVLITVLGGLSLAYATRRRLARRDTVYVAAELYPPGLMWWIFGIGGIIAIAKPDGLPVWGPYNDTTVALVACYAAVGSAIYILAFRAAAGRLAPRSNVELKAPPPGLAFILLGLVAFDWYMRIRMIRGGMYVRQMASITTVAGPEMQGWLVHAFTTGSFVLIALAAYFAMRGATRARRIAAKTLIFVQMLLVFAGGDRSDFVYAVLVLTLTILLFQEPRVRKKTIRSLIVLAVIYFGLVSPAVQEARFIMRRDALQLMADPASVPMRFIDTYLMEVIKAGPGQLHSESRRRQVGFSERSAAYMTYAAAMYQSMLDGTRPQEFSRFLKAFGTLVPRALHPDKVSVDADASLLRHFGLARADVDAFGTPFADVLSYLRLPGVVWLFAVLGAGYGLLARFLRARTGTTGDVLMIGFLPGLGPHGDAFTKPLALMEHAWLLALLFVCALAVARILPATRRQAAWTNVSFASEAS